MHKIMRKKEHAPRSSFSFSLSSFFFLRAEKREKKEEKREKIAKWR
jgi:hypothetical protein